MSGLNHLWLYCMNIQLIAINEWLHFGFQLLSTNPSPLNALRTRLISLAATTSQLSISLASVDHGIALRVANVKNPYHKRGRYDRTNEPH